MKASVIIPTYNGAGKLPKILQALENQQYRNFETIVVVDGSTDNSLELLENKKSTVPGLKVISQMNMGRGKARNTGAAAATGDVLIFFDDDILPGHDCINRHLEHHQRMAESILFGVCRMNISHDPHNDFFLYRHSIEENWHAPFKDQLTKISFDVYAFTSANLSMPVKTFARIGGFDDTLNDSEDFDFSIKALITGSDIYFDYSIWTWHCDYIDIAEYIKRQREYLRSKAALAITKPEYVKLLPKSFGRGNIKGFKRMLSVFFRYNRVWAYIVHSHVFLSVIPRKIRYKIYNKIIFSSSIH